ncbi:hypothetical protein SppYZU01_03 [Shewanella phage SppYZU01]|nr:hypothetical protein SppYZU01_03 [Shewanella phage SppYZU01]
MFGVDNRDIRELERDLKTFANRAYPYATRQTLNDTAFQAQRIAREDVRNDMVLRNRFTVQSIQVDQARTLAVSRQAATVGSIADYMEDQEFGATKAKKGSEGVAIATSYSAGQGQDAQPRTRLPRKPNKLANIQLQNKRRRGSSRKQRNLIAIKDAAASGNKFVFLDLGRRKGIFRVTGGKRNPKIRMVHDLSNQSVVIPKNPWLKPAFDESLRMLPAFYADALRFQLRRNGLFR